MDIHPIFSPGPQAQPVSPGEAGGEGPSFTQTLKESIQQVNDLQVQSDQAIADLMAGKGSMHETLIALQKADTSFQLMMQIRNKIVTAYEEIVRMQV